MDTISALWELDTLQRAEDFLAISPRRPLLLQNFVGSEFRPHSASDKWIKSFNPRTGDVLAQVPRSALSDVGDAVDAAAQAFPSWSQTSRLERSEVLQRVASILAEKKELFAVWESIDQGKTLERARVETDRAVTNFRYVEILYTNTQRCSDDSLPGTLPRISCMTMVRFGTPMVNRRS